MSHNISGVIKSIQNIMRNDRGLNGDAQRIEQLGWMIFLKIFDDKDLDDLYQELKKFISYTENENKVINNRVALMDSINIIINYFNKLEEKPDIKVRVINQSEISENE